uniref:Uncharacterized protein n=2 Tax=Davidia involucrata TaxID=16924 RepID=A0A5B7AP97_DAVIN
MEDENGLELSLGLSCGGSSAKLKGKNGSSAATRTEDGDRSNKLVDNFKNFLHSDTWKQDSGTGSQRNDPLKHEENFFNNLSKASVGVDRFTNLNGHGLWIANSNGSAEVEEEKRPEAGNKPKILFDETSHQKKREREAHHADLQDNCRTSHISITTDDGSTADNEDVADSEVEGSTSRLIHHDDYSKRYTGGGGGCSSEVPKEVHMVTDSNVVDFQGQKRYKVSPEKEFKLGSTPYGVPFPTQSVNIIKLPYSLPTKESNSVAALSTSGYPLPGMMRVMATTNSEGSGTQAVMPGNLPLMFGHSPVRLPMLDKDNSWGLVSHPQQLQQSYAGRGATNSDKQNDVLKLSLGGPLLGTITLSKEEKSSVQAILFPPKRDFLTILTPRNLCEIKPWGMDKIRKTLLVHPLKPKKSKRGVATSAALKPVVVKKQKTTHVPEPQKPEAEATSEDQSVHKEIDDYPEGATQTEATTSAPKGKLKKKTHFPKVEDAMRKVWEDSWTKFLPKTEGKKTVEILHSCLSSLIQGAHLAAILACLNYEGTLEMSEAADKVVKLQAELEKARTDLGVEKSLSAELQDQVMKLGSILDNRETLMASLEAKVKGLEKDATEKSALITSLTSSNDNLKNDVRGLEIELLNRDSDLAVVRRELEETKGHLSNVDEAFSQYRQESEGFLMAEGTNILMNGWNSCKKIMLGKIKAAYPKADLSQFEPEDQDEDEGQEDEAGQNAVAIVDAEAAVAEVVAPVGDVEANDVA